MLYLSPTFLDSFRYWRKMESGEASDAARKQLIDRLKGVKTDPTEAQQKGIDFEREVIKHITGGYDEKYPACELADKIAQFVGKENHRQVPVNIYISRHELGSWGKDVKLTGYIDFLTPSGIIDVKTTSEYFVGKYINNMQHHVYLEDMKILGYKSFHYAVTDWNEFYVETYHYTKDTRGHIIEAIKDVLLYAQWDKEFFEALKGHKCYQSEEEVVY